MALGGFRKAVRVSFIRLIAVQVEIAHMKLWRGQPDHDHWKTSFTAKERAHLSSGLGFCMFTLGFMEWTSPQAPPFTGKWAWLFSWTYSNFGPHGAVGLYLALGTLLIRMGIVSLLLSRNSQSKSR